MSHKTITKESTRHNIWWGMQKHLRSHPNDKQTQKRAHELGQQVTTKKGK